MVLGNCSTVTHTKESLVHFYYSAGATRGTTTQIVAGPSVAYGLIGEFYLVAISFVKLTPTYPQPGNNSSNVNSLSVWSHQKGLDGLRGEVWF